MTQLGTPYSGEEIRDVLTIEFEAVHEFFQDISDETFFTAPPDVWSPADNLVHLIKACSPVILALKLPQLALRARFGQAEHASRSLAEIRNTYVNGALAGGGVASGRYLPQVDEESPAEKQRLLSEWQKKGSQLTAVLTKWSEEDLDKYVLPHPLLGSLTVREILFFTLYHNMHHVNDVQRLLNQVESEWFEPVHTV